jgi:hypothetical protein
MRTRTIITIIGAIAIMLASCERKSGRRKPFSQPATQPSEASAEQQKVYFTLESVGKIETYHLGFLLVARHYDLTVVNDSTTPKGSVFNLFITYDGSHEQEDNLIRIQRRMASELAQAKTVGRPAIYAIDASDIYESVKLADRYESKIWWKEIKHYRTPVPANPPDALFDPVKPNQNQ